MIISLRTENNKRARYFTLQLHRPTLLGMLCNVGSLLGIEALDNQVVLTSHNLSCSNLWGRQKVLR